MFMRIETQSGIIHYLNPVYIKRLMPHKTGGATVEMNDGYTYTVKEPVEALLQNLRS